MIGQDRVVSRSLLFVLALMLVGCAPSESPSAGSGSAERASAEQRTLVVGFWGEPTSLASLPVRGSGQGVRAVTRLFNAELDLQDPLELPHPYLAESIPRLNTETWQVFPDGRMETRYRLRPGLTWHDGTALSAHDFAFGWQVYGNPDVGVASVPVAQMEEVVAIDERTVVIRWKRPYPGADSLYENFQALPRHILESYLRDNDIDGLVNHGYWGLEYVGLGPYRLARWEPGTFVEGIAFERHALGRPKIDRVIARLIADENAILTTVLAEEIHFAPKGLRFEHANVLKQEWAQNNRGVLVLIPIQPRFIHFQLRPEVVQPRALLDVRARRALLHAIDKPALDEGLFGGERAGTHTFLYRGVPYHAEIERAVTKYPYDLRRTEQLMGELGYRKGPDGVFVGEDGERFSAEFWGDVGPQFEQDHAAVSAGWRQAGFETRPTFVAPAQLRDGQYRSSFRGMYFTATGTGTEPTLKMLSSADIPREANRFTGSNRGAWASPEFDRLWESFNTTLDRAERNRYAIEMEKLISDQLPLLIVFHNFHVVAYLASLKGPDTRGQRDLIFWNIQEWELQ